MENTREKERLKQQPLHLLLNWSLQQVGRAHCVQGVTHRTANEWLLSTFKNNDTSTTSFLPFPVDFDMSIPNSKVQRVTISGREYYHLEVSAPVSLLTTGILHNTIDMNSKLQDATHTLLVWPNPFMKSSKPHTRAHTHTHVRTHTQHVHHAWC